MSFWRLVGARPRPAGRFDVPPGLPRITGPAFGEGDDWWIPCSTGFYRVQSATGQWRLHPLETEFPIERVMPAGDLVLAGNGVETMVLAPQDAPRGGESGARAELHRIRKHLHSFRTLQSAPDRSCPGRLSLLIEQMIPAHAAPESE